MSNINSSLNWAHPLVQKWFLKKFGSPTEPQEQGWPHILAGKATLISAPTGSGKTFAAFLICINQLVRMALANELPDQTKVVYVSPLKALSNDIQKNLMEPLHEIIDLAKLEGIQMQEIRVAVRTGDTLAKERQKMLKKPPHILVTTPESFYILLTATKSRELLRTIETVIIDEIHALANDKRGAHLCLSLERLEVITASPFVRIGLSATQKPLDQMGHFLVGNTRALPQIIDIGYARHLDLKIEVPKTKLSAVASNEMWDEMYDRLSELTQKHRSVLIFVNTRRLAERIAHHIAERIGIEYVAAHHGSLSRKIRLTVETKLKNGELKALVATASLELGIDIGSIDLVCQIGSPRAIAIGLQRVGRAGHWRGAISKGIFFATTRDELIECTALVNAIHKKDLDRLIIPYEPLDILAQQIVALCVTQEWHEKALFEVIKKAFHYANLSFETYDSLLTMLSEGIAGTRARYSTYLFRDKVNGLIKARRQARIVAITCGGAIPDNGLFTVLAEPEKIVVGTLDEDFAVESNRGDIILLGSTSWKVERVESYSGRVIVQDAYGAPPSVPFWRGEAPARSNELSYHVSQLRQQLGELDIEEGIRFLKDISTLSPDVAKQIVDYISEGKAILGAVPSQDTIIAERFFDESGGMQLIIHAPFGARINKAWGLALRKKFCRSFNFELQASATDNGINISLTEQHSFPLADVFHFLHPNSIKDVLTQAVLQSPLFTTRWRWDATRSLALIRFRNGKKMPPNILRMLSEDLLAAIFPDAAACQDNLAGRDIQLPNHPLINETMKDALTEALDIDGFVQLLNKIYNGSIECIAIDTLVPSPFSHEILNANPYAFLDDAPLEERRARAVQMRQTLPESTLRAIGKLDPKAIKEVKQQSWFDIRNADELHDALQTLITFPDEKSDSQWEIFLNQLAESNRIGLAIIDNKRFWFPAEKSETFKTLYPAAKIAIQPATISQVTLSYEECMLIVVRGWMLHLGPTTSHELRQILYLDVNDIEQALLRLEGSGSILRGIFSNTKNITTEWCERRLLARIHRLTLNYLRNEITSLAPMEFFNWLLVWQHVAPQAQLSGEQGLLEVIKQLQGFEVPANAWEQFIFPTRVKDYKPLMLDHLTLMGVVGWGRISLHPALNESEKKRINPTSITPITFFMRENYHWLSASARGNFSLDNVSHIAKDIYFFLKEKGASFFNDIVNGVNHLKAQVEAGLWELVSVGLVTADSFDNLRSLIDPTRRLNKRRRRLIRHGAGRWSLLPSINENTIPDLEAICWMLLKRYGVVFRDLLIREKLILPWRALLTTYRQLEARGEIRGGRFVTGFVGEQFALPYAVESLRAIRKDKKIEEKNLISTVDPLNLYGILLPGKKISTISRKIIET